MDRRMDGVSNLTSSFGGHWDLSLGLLLGLAFYGAAAIAYPLYRLTVSLSQPKKKAENAQIDISQYLETFKALQESEQRYRHLYQETPAMLHSVDRQGHFVSVSHYWLEKLGYDKSEVIGKPLSRFVADESKQKVEDILLELEANVICRDQLCYFLKPTFRTSNWHIGYLNEAIRITAIFSSMVLNS